MAVEGVRRRRRRRGRSPATGRLLSSPWPLSGSVVKPAGDCASSPLPVVKVQEQVAALSHTCTNHPNLPQLNQPPKRKPTQTDVNGSTIGWTLSSLQKFKHQFSSGQIVLRKEVKCPKKCHQFTLWCFTSTSHNTFEQQYRLLLLYFCCLLPSSCKGISRNCP